MARDTKAQENYEGDLCYVQSLDERDGTMVIVILKSTSRSHVNQTVKKIPEDALEPLV